MTALCVGIALLFAGQAAIVAMLYRREQRRRQERDEAMDALDQTLRSYRKAREELSDCRDLLVGDVTQALHPGNEAF